MAFNINNFINELKKAKTDEEKTRIIRKYSNEKDLNNAVYIEQVTRNIPFEDIIKFGLEKAREQAKKEISTDISNIPQKGKLKKEDYEDFMKIMEEESED